MVILWKDKIRKKFQSSVFALVIALAQSGPIAKNIKLSLKDHLEENQGSTEALCLKGIVKSKVGEARRGGTSG